MSLLNRPSQGFHSSLVAIYKLLLYKKKLSREKIQALCAPPTLFEGKPPGHIRQTLNTWLKLGLFEENPDGEVIIRKEIAKQHPSPELLPSAARQFVLMEDNNQNFFESEDSGSADFTRLLAWSLMQDVWEYDQTSHEEVELHLKKQTKSDFSVFQQNNTRWSGFKAWALFLGYGWTPRYPKSKFEPDPTVAIRDCLPDVFASAGTLDAPAMLRQLAERIPVLDGGRYRNMVEERLGESEGEYSWQPLPSGQLSTTLSRALLRLREEGTLTFADKDDSEHRRSLTGRDRQTIESLTHITWKGGKA